MITSQEMVLKAQHDAWLASVAASKNESLIDYLAMMSDVEIPEEEEFGDESEI